jgi:hypothetical protein
LRDLYDKSNRINNAAIRLSQAPKDLVRRRAREMGIRGAARNETLKDKFLLLWNPAFRLCKARKKIIIKYPPNIFGEGKVPMARLDIRMSLA